MGTGEYQVMCDGIQLHRLVSAAEQVGDHYAQRKIVNLVAIACRESPSFMREPHERGVNRMNHESWRRIRVRSEAK